MDIAPSKFFGQWVPQELQRRQRCRTKATPYLRRVVYCRPQEKQLLLHILPSNQLFRLLLWWAVTKGRKVMARWSYESKVRTNARCITSLQGSNPIT